QGALAELQRFPQLQCAEPGLSEHRGGHQCLHWNVLDIRVLHYLRACSHLPRSSIKELLMLGHRKLEANDYVAILKRPRKLIIIPVVLLPLIMYGITYFI